MLAQNYAFRPLPPSAPPPTEPRPSPDPAEATLDARISPMTVPNSVLPSEGIASREEGYRRVAWFLFPDSHFPLALPPIGR
jgi:hypothetical protein